MDWTGRLCVVCKHSSHDVIDPNELKEKISQICERLGVSLVQAEHPNCPPSGLILNCIHDAKINLMGIKKI